MTLTEIDPRIQERREEVQREVGEKRRRIALLVVGALLAVGMVFLLVQSPMLDVDHVRVSGNAHVSADDVRAAAGVHNGDPILLVDTQKIRGRVVALPWVASAEVHRSLPGTLRIVVHEEDPVAFVRRDDTHVALLADDGHVIADVENAPPGATEVRGVRKAPAIGKMISPPEAAGVVRALPAELANQVIAIDVGGTGVALDLARGGEVRLGSMDALDAKAAAAIAVLKQWGDKPLQYVDVSVPQNPTAR
jgi:cell division protein FtsQ